MPEDESSCFELECCPLGIEVPDTLTSSFIEVEIGNTGPYPDALDSLTLLQTEDFEGLLT